MSRTLREARPPHKGGALRQLHPYSLGEGYTVNFLNSAARAGETEREGKWLAAQYRAHRCDVGVPRVGSQGEPP